MKRFAEDIKRGLRNAWQLLLGNRTSVLFVLAAAMAVLSYFAVPSGVEIYEAAARLEKNFNICHLNLLKMLSSLGFSDLSFS